MDTMTFCVPCLFGLEGLVGDELRRLDLQNVRVEDRRVFFEGDFAAMAKANLCCRMGERVMILLAEFDAHSFEDLFQGVKAVPLERFIPKNGAFPVKGYSLNSQLHSVPDCQAIVKKAAVTRLGEKYGLGWLPETKFADGIQKTIRLRLCQNCCRLIKYQNPDTGFIQLTGNLNKLHISYGKACYLHVIFNLKSNGF